MARVNVGINPRFLSDQHLIAESVEITMITGALRKDKWLIKGDVPKTYCLGKGHVNFFKPKPLYLKDRLHEVNEEMRRRGFNPSTTINLLEFEFPQGNKFGPKHWTPSWGDTCIVRSRIIDRLKNPLKAKQNFHRWYGKPIENIEEFTQQLKKSELFYV